jgi:hypothetical protein
MPKDACFWGGGCLALEPFVVPNGPVKLLASILYV